MKNTVIVVTDLGLFRAYRLEKNRLESTPRLELIEEFATVDAHGKLTDKLTDQAGRYRSPTSAKWATPWGERHNIELEQRKRLIRQLAERLNILLGRKEYEACHFAAAKEINHQLLDLLTPEARAKIVKNVPADLAKVDKSELLARMA